MENQVSNLCLNQNYYFRNLKGYYSAICYNLAIIKDWRNVLDLIKYNTKFNSLMEFHAGLPKTKKLDGFCLLAKDYYKEKDDYEDSNYVLVFYNKKQIDEAKEISYTDENEELLKDLRDFIYKEHLEKVFNSKVVFYPRIGGYNENYSQYYLEDDPILDDINYKIYVSDNLKGIEKKIEKDFEKIKDWYSYEFDENMVIVDTNKIWCEDSKKIHLYIRPESFEKIKKAPYIFKLLLLKVNKEIKDMRKKRILKEYTDTKISEILKKYKA